MRKVIELLGMKKVNGDIGIEIECEGRGMVSMDNEVWRSEDDGSLRGNYPDSRCEYILAKPLKADAVEVALMTLRNHLNDEGAVLDFSHRCSVHVHVNVQQLEYQQLLAFMYAYYLLEEPFMTYCGKSRKGNNFCLRLADAEGVLEVVEAMFEYGEEGIQHIGADRQRYAAMNFEALRKYGSIEFRGMEGNMDVDRINKWAQALIRMREFAVKMDNPKAVYELFQEKGPVGFVTAVVGDLSPEFHYLKLVKDIQKSFSLSIDLPFMFMSYIGKPKPKDFVKGQVINHAQAVDVVERGGNVHLREDGKYEVRDVPRRGKNKKAFDMFNAVPQGMEDF